MFFNAILSLEGDNQNTKETGLFKLYHIIFITEVLPTVGKLSRGNFGAWPQISLSRQKKRPTAEILRESGG